MEIHLKGWFSLLRNCFVLTHVKFYVRKWNRGNVLKAIRERESRARFNSYVYAWPSIHCLYFIFARKNYFRPLSFLGSFEYRKTDRSTDEEREGGGGGKMCARSASGWLFWAADVKYRYILVPLDSLNLFSGNSFVSWRKRHSSGQAYQAMGTRGVPCVLWQTRRRWWPPVLLWDCQGVCCIFLCNRGYQVFPSRWVGEEEWEGVTHWGRDTLPVFSRSRERRWTKVETLWFWRQRFLPGAGGGGGGVNSLIWSRRGCASGYGVLGLES